VLSGCGSDKPTGQVKGTVTFEGTPVTVGMLQIHSDDGTLTRNGRIGDGGHFDIADAPVGKVTLTIDVPASMQRKRAKRPVLNTKTPELPATQEVPDALKGIPAKYREMDKSGLHFTINPGPNEIDVRLSRK